MKKLAPEKIDEIVVAGSRIKIARVSGDEAKAYVSVRSLLQPLIRKQGEGRSYITLSNASARIHGDAKLYRPATVVLTGKDGKQTESLGIPWDMGGFLVAIELEKLPASAPPVLVAMKYTYIAGYASASADYVMQIGLPSTASLGPIQEELRQIRRALADVQCTRCGRSPSTAAVEAFHVRNVAKYYAGHCTCLGLKDGKPVCPRVIVADGKPVRNAYGTRVFDIHHPFGVPSVSRNENTQPVHIDCHVAIHDESMRNGGVVPLRFLEHACGYLKLVVQPTLFG